MRRLGSPRRICAIGVFALLASWLALSDGPAQRRLGEINQAFSDGKLGRLSPQLQTRLQRQVEWLARHAAVNGTVSVNSGVARDRLDIVVTTPELAGITQCGKGNAIYDPTLDAIFVDIDLVRPVDLPHIGNPGAITMSSPEDFGFVVSGLSFVLAHEMGHRQSGAGAAAFFALDWLQLGGDATEQELAADRFAVRTLMRAQQAGDAPESLREKNALDFTGLARSGLSSKEWAAADIMGSMIGMSLAMQFASSPYSPFFRDAAHPSFLERAQDAIGQVSGETSARIVGQAPVLAEQIRRTRSLGHWRHHELHPPDPLARVEVRDGVVWIGTRAFYQTGADQPRERLYRLDLDSDPPQFLLVKEGRSLEGEFPGMWLNSLLEAGDPTLGLPAVTPPEVREERHFEPFRKWRSDGVAYAGQAWFWKDGDGERWIAVKEVERQARMVLGAEGVELGKPVRVDDQILVPTMALHADGKSRLRVIAVKSGVVSAAQPPFGLDFSPDEGWIDVEGVLRDEGQWFAPGRVASANEPYRWRLWRLADGAKPVLAAEGRLLASFIGPGGDRSFGRDLDPSEANLLPLENGLLLLWFDNDSAWLVGPHRMDIAFHPANPGLRVAAVGNGWAIFWIENAMKAYLVDFNQTRGELE